MRNHLENGHIDFLGLADFVDENLDSGSKEKIEFHLSTCGRCTETLENIRDYYHQYGSDRQGLDNYLKESKSDIVSFIQEVQTTPEMLAEKAPVEINSPLTYLKKIAAVFVVLLIPLVIFLYANREDSATALVDEYLLEAYFKPPIARGNDDFGRLWGSVSVDYENKKYQKTIETLQIIIKEKKTLPMAHFYLGLCYLYTQDEDNKNGTDYFKKVLEVKNPYQEQALWYLGLAQFRNGNLQGSKETLKKVKGYKKNEAQNLLEKFQ